MHWSEFIFVMIFFDQMNQFFERIVITLGEGYSSQLSYHTSSICNHHQADPHHFLSGNKTVVLSASSLLSPCSSLTLNFSTYHHMNTVTFFYEEKNWINCYTKLNGFFFLNHFKARLINLKLYKVKNKIKNNQIREH